jgi:hypothetical protein
MRRGSHDDERDECGAKKTQAHGIPLGIGIERNYGANVRDGRQTVKGAVAPGRVLDRSDGMFARVGSQAVERSATDSDHV